MKLEYDTRMRVLESNINVGSLVLIKLNKERKTTPIWDPDPYRVTNINGTQITAQRHDRTTTRNSSFFKLYREKDENWLSETKFFFGSLIFLYSTNSFVLRVIVNILNVTV